MTVRDYIFYRFEEGILGAVGQTALAPARVVKAGVQTAVGVPKAGLQAAGGGLKAIGKVAQGKPGQALDVLGQTATNVGQTAIAPAKTVGNIVRKPLASLGG